MTPVLPAPRWARACGVALAGTLLLWLPLTVLPVIDGLLFNAPALDVARDLALLSLLSLLPALLLGTLAHLTFRLCARRAEFGKGLGWSLLLLPLLWICLRQFARMALAWLGAVQGAPLQLGSDLKTLLMALSVAALLLLFARLGWQRMLAKAVQALSAGRGAAYALLLASLLLVIAHPPRFVTMASRPASAVAPALAHPNILLITLDAVAAADAQACDPDSALMPQLARFARQATCFTRFYTASNFTTSTTSTIESGLLPWTHQANQPFATMAKAERGHSLAAQLQAQGWRTHSITDNLLASPRQRGSFEGYDSAWLSETGLVGNSYREAAARLPDTALPQLVALSLAWLNVGDHWLNDQDSPYRSETVYADLERLLRQEQVSGAPQFIWAHTLPPHAPYLPPASTRYRLLARGELDSLKSLLPDNIEYPAGQQALVDKHRLRYRESLLAADAALGAQLDRLEASGWLSKAIVVISTDHGESFEKGYLGHAGARLHDAVMHGPLLIRLPGQREGRVVDAPVSQVDLAPTLLELAGAPALPAAEGRSLRPWLIGETLPTVPVFAMAMEHQSRFKPLRSGHFVVIDGDDKLIWQTDSGRTELYDLARDPAEQQDRAAKEPQTVARLRQFIDQGLKRAEQRRAAGLASR